MKITRKIALSGAAVLALTAAAPAEMATLRIGSHRKVRRKAAPAPTAYAVRAPKPPTIDGRPDEPAWSAAAVLRIARTLRGDRRAGELTDVRLLRDDKHLYVACRCAEPGTDRIKARKQSHDGELWSEDSVEVFLGTPEQYYHFIVNAAGSTYDGRAKDKAWNSGFRAAAAIGKKAWTAEMAIPLAKVGDVTGETRWVAAFNRNRHAGGGWEEFAWSPTYEGDSHVPGRFGKLKFEPPPKKLPDEGEAEDPAEAVTIKSVEAAAGVVRFNLSELPRDARIHRADLLIRRTKTFDARDPAAGVDIAIYPLFAPAGQRVGKPPGKPLALRRPWFDRFDATDAVRAWVGGKLNAGFLVKTLPYWHAESTCLEIAYEGRPEEVPPQVRGLQAFHRGGQTFITWQEIEDLIGADEPRWAGLRRVLADLDKRREVRYCVYRHRKRITPATLADAECIARVKPLSGWNVNGRSVEKPIDELLANEYALIHGQWDPFVGADPDGKWGVKCKMERFVIGDAGEMLPRTTGLYVHTTQEKGRFYYAVITAIDGVENTTAVDDKCSLAEPVAEAPADPRPVLQKEFPPRPHWNYPERRYHYVRWVAAPDHGNLPSHYYNWSVGVPDVVPADRGGRGRGEMPADGVPVELSLHRDHYSYWRTQYRVELNSLVLTPHDFPLRTAWYGYHEAQGTLKSFRRGFVHNYTQRRLLSFVQWARAKWPVDGSRVFVTGQRGTPGTGALHLGLRHPEVFSAVQAGFAVADFKAAIQKWPQWRRMKRYIPDVERIWGPVDADCKTALSPEPPADAPSVWDHMNLTAMVRRRPAAKDLPLVTISGRIYYQPTRDFFLAMMEQGHFIAGSFSVWGGPKLVPMSLTGNLARGFTQDIGRNVPLPVFRVGIAGLRAEPRKGRYDVSFNLGLHWSDPLEEPGRFEITLRYTGYRGRPTTTAVTFRRLRRFKVASGRSYAWRFTPAEGSKTEPQSGEITVGDDGLLTVPGLTFDGPGGRLSVTPE